MITPADSPSSPGNYAAVPVQPLDIQAPTDDLAAVTEAAVSLAAPGGPRQAQSETLLSGADGPSVTAGYSGGGGEDWTADPRPAGA
jgi:hypothetical protein